MPPTLLVPANRECRMGCALFCWSSVGATNPPIKEVGPTIAFDTAFDGEQSVCVRFRPASARVYQPKNGMHPAGLDSVRPTNSSGLEEEQKRYQQFLPVWVRSSSFGQPAAWRDIQSRMSPDDCFRCSILPAGKPLVPDFDQRYLAPLYPKKMGCTLLDWVRRDSANSNGFEEEQNDEGSRSCPPLNSVQTAMIGPKLESSSIVSKLMRFMPVSNERVLVFFPHPLNPHCSFVQHFHISSLPFLIPSFRPRLN